MANVAFRRGDTAYINAIAVTDGQLLFDTESQAIYMDNGSSRNRYGGGNLSRSDVDTALKADSINPVQNKVIYASVLKKTDVINTLSSAIAVTDTRVPVGCGVAKELNNKISNGGDAYSPSRPYKVGDLCIHDNKLYRCTTACSAGSWATNQNCFTADTLVNVANSNYQVLVEQDASQATQATPWVCVSDGYIKVTNNNSDSYCSIIIDDEISIEHYFTSAMPYETFAIFVKKGMRFYVTRQNFNGYIQFHPIVQR